MQPDRLPESICELCSLRYLDISRSHVQELPEKFWCLYSLQVLDASNSCLRKIHENVTKLIRLRRIALPQDAFKIFLGVRRIGYLSRLENLSHFRVGRDNGRKIAELKGMNQLSGKLSILSLNNVQSTEEAAEARLFEKQYIKELILQWEDNKNMVRQLRTDQNGVVEGLRPHPRTGRLEIQGFCGDMFSPTWFRREDLSTLRSLKLYRCLHLKCLSIPCMPSLEELELIEVGIEILTTLDGIHAGSTGNPRARNSGKSRSCSNGISSCAFPRLTSLRLTRCNKLTNLYQFLSPENLPSVKLISFKRCINLVSIPVHSFVGLVYLQGLKIYGCDKLACPQGMVLPSSLQRLFIAGCGELDISFPACLENLTSLSLLQLVHCHNIRFLPLNSIAGIRFLVLRYCPELSSLGVSHTQVLSSIQHVEVSKCPKLTEVEQPFEKMELQTEDSELLKFLKL